MDRRNESTSSGALPSLSLPSSADISTVTPSSIIAFPRSSWLGARKRDVPHPVQEHAVWCNTVQFAGVQYFNTYWKLQPEPGPSDYLDARWDFKTGVNGDFDCELLMAMANAFAILTPEFAVADIELGEAIEVVCEQAKT